MKSVILLCILILVATVECTFYDYIVVGAGATGSVVAARLSESGASVLVLDAGAPSQASVGGKDYVAASYYFDDQGKVVFNPPLTRYDVPIFARSASQADVNNPTPGFPLNTSFPRYKGIQEVHSRILGGNSVHNNMVWTRLTKESLESWGLQDWTYNETLPYWKKTENVTGSRLNGDYEYHGHNGPIQLTEERAMDKAGPAFVQACQNAGYPYNNDFNRPVRDGCGFHVFNINSKGVRGSSLNEYLAPALKKRSNIKLQTDSLVTKILFLDVFGVKFAKAVEYVINGQKKTVYANREIVVCAGAFNSPKLLMLSGVGPKEHLQSLGIPVVADLPVGYGIGTHTAATVRYRYFTDYANPYDVSSAAVQYARFGTGIFASTGFFGFLFVKSNNTRPDPDLLLGVILGNNSPVGQITGFLSHHQPKYRFGRITLTSKDYNVPPLYSADFFQYPEDVYAVAQGIRILRKVMTTYPANVTFGPELIPGPAYRDNCTNNSTQKCLEDYVRETYTIPNLTHMWGGCNLGTVLDTRMKVKKVQGLRVADLSIVPGTLGGHPIANAFMFGERVSEWMLKDANLPTGKP